MGWTQFWVKSCDGECALDCKGASFSRTIKELKFPLWYGVGEGQIWDSVTRSHGLWCYYHLWTSSCLQKPHSPCHKLHQGPTSCGMLTTCNWTFHYSAQNVTFGCKWFHYAKGGRVCQILETLHDGLVGNQGHPDMACAGPGEYKIRGSVGKQPESQKLTLPAFSFPHCTRRLREKVPTFPYLWKPSTHKTWLKKLLSFWIDTFSRVRLSSFTCCWIWNFCLLPVHVLILFRLILNCKIGAVLLLMNIINILRAWTYDWATI